MKDECGRRITLPQPTCPTIDKLIAAASDAGSLAKDIERDALPDYVVSHAEDIRRSLFDIIEYAEEIREANSTLRTWAEEYVEHECEVPE